MKDFAKLISHECDDRNAGMPASHRRDFETRPKSVVGSSTLSSEAKRTGEKGQVRGGGSTPRRINFNRAAEGSPLANAISGVHQEVVRLAEPHGLSIFDRSGATISEGRLERLLLDIHSDLQRVHEQHPACSWFGKSPSMSGGIRRCEQGGGQ